MKFLSLLLSRIRALADAEKVHAEIAEELQFHLEMKQQDLQRNGISGGEARLAAARAFGSADRIREQAYDVRGGGLLEDLRSDVRFASRLLRKNWIKTLVLVATLALGIGVNTAVFEVVSSVLLHPLPFPDPASLVVLQQANHGQVSGVSYPHFKDWLAGSHSFQSLAVYASDSATFSGPGEAAIVNGAITSSSLFRVLNVTPLRGRLFTADEDHFISSAKTTSPVLISDRFWRLRFGERADILGQILHLDGRSFEIVGVIPSRLAFPIQKDPVDYWKTVAVDADPALYGGSIPVSRGYPRYDGAIARLKPGVTLAQARSEMEILAKTIAREHPKATSSNDISIKPELEDVVGRPGRSMILILYCAVCCVLLVACMNVANILLVDALARRREFSLRLALGAPMIRLIRQLLVESMMISLAGGMAGLPLAWCALKLFLAFAPPDTPRLNEIQLSGATFLYVIAVSLLGGFILGCLPALAAKHISLGENLKEGSRSVTRRASLLQPGSLLICGQIVLGMTLTCCAGILVSNFQQILQANRGFNPHGVLSASVSLPVAQYGQASNRVLTYYRTLLERIRSVPGVQAASLAQVLPLSGQSNSTTVSVEGATLTGMPSTDLRIVDASYFEALHIPLLRGRAFNQTDTASRPGCIIVNQAFVRRFLPGANPDGIKIRLGWGGEGAKQIVGVVADVRHLATSPVTQPEVYVPLTQFPVNDMSIVLRTAGDPYRVATPLLAIARGLDSSVPMDRVRSLDDYLLLSSSTQAFLMWLLIVFAAATMLLSAIGLYGVLSDSVLARSQEFGIRLALGSSLGRLAGLVLRQGLSVTLAGMLIGGAASVFAARSLQHWLYESGAANPGVLIASGAVVMLVALAACLLPAYNAASLDPVSLLRET